MTVEYSEIRQTLLEKVRARGFEKSICPSEVARALGGEDWRSLMDAVRQVGAELREEGLIVALQKGHPVHPLQAKGPIRFKLVNQQRPNTSLT
ncbi:MAG: DUF3253 domain-containing protein [Elainellaceae cyanobacterium]